MDDQNDFSDFADSQMDEKMRRMLMPDTGMIKKSPGTLSINNDNPSEDDVLEAILGDNEIVDHGIIAGLVDVGRAVARIRTPGHASLASTHPDELASTWDRLDQNAELGGFVGTGWIFGSSRKLMMTNNHVIPVAKAAARSRVEFNYQRDARTESTSKSHTMRLDPDAFFVTSPTMRWGGLDYTLVAFSEAASDELNFLDYEPGNTALHAESVFVVQHPGGSPKAYVVNHNKKINLTDRYFTYTSDTKGGSSGSPLFDGNLNLIGIHHIGNHQVRVRGRRITTNLGSRMEEVIDDLIAQMKKAGMTTDQVDEWFGEGCVAKKWRAAQ